MSLRHIIAKFTNFLKLFIYTVSVFTKFLAGVVLIFLAMLFVRCFLEFGAQTLQSHSADYLTKRLCDKN
jgi:hypothetical protein